MAGKVILRMGEAGDDVMNIAHGGVQPGAPKGGEEALKALEGVGSMRFRADDVCIWDSLPGQEDIQRVNRWNEYPTAANFNNVLAAFDNKKIQQFILNGRPDKGFAADSLDETAYTNANYKSRFRIVEASKFKVFNIGGPFMQPDGTVIQGETDINKIIKAGNRSFASRLRGATYMPIADPYIRRWDWGTAEEFVTNAMVVATMFMTLDYVEEIEGQAQQKIDAIVATNDAKMSAHLKAEAARIKLHTAHQDVASLKLEAEYKKAYKEVFDSRAKGFVKNHWGAVPAGSTAEPFTGFHALFSQLTWTYDKTAQRGWMRQKMDANNRPIMRNGRPVLVRTSYPPKTQFRYRRGNLTSYTDKKGLTNIDPAQWSYPKYTASPPPRLQEVPEAPDFGLVKQIATGFIAFKLCLAAIGTLAWAFQKLSKHKGSNGRRYEYNSSGEKFYHTPRILQPEVGEKLWITQLKIYIAGHDPIGFLANLWDGGILTIASMFTNIDEEFQNHYKFDINNSDPVKAKLAKERKKDLSKKLKAQWYRMAITSIFEGCRDTRAHLAKLDHVMSTYKTRGEAIVNPGGGPLGTLAPLGQGVGSTWRTQGDFETGTEYLIDQPCSEAQRFRAIIRQKHHEIDTFMKRIATMIWTSQLRGSDLEGGGGNFANSYLVGGGELRTPKLAEKKPGRTIKVRVISAEGVQSVKHVSLSSVFGLPEDGTGQMWKAHAYAEAIMSLREDNVVDPDSGIAVKSWRGIIGDVNLRWRGEGYSMENPPIISIKTSQTRTEYHGSNGTSMGQFGQPGGHNSTALPMHHLGREMDSGGGGPTPTVLPCNCTLLSKDAMLVAEVAGKKDDKLVYKKVDGTYAKVPSGVKAGQIVYIRVVDGGWGYTEQPVIEIPDPPGWASPTANEVNGPNQNMLDDNGCASPPGAWTADFQQNAATERYGSEAGAAVSRAMMDRELERLLVCEGINWEQVHNGMMDYIQNFNFRLSQAGMVIAPSLALDFSGQSTDKLVKDDDQFKAAVAQAFGLHNAVSKLGRVNSIRMPKSHGSVVWLRHFGGLSTGSLFINMSLKTLAAAMIYQRADARRFTRFNMLRNYDGSARLYTGTNPNQVTNIDVTSKKRILEIGNYTPTFGFCNDATIQGMDQDLATKFFKNKAAYSVYGLPNKIKQGLCQKHACGALHAYATVPPLGLQYELSRGQQEAIFGPKGPFETNPGDIATANFKASNKGSTNDPDWWSTVAKSMDPGDNIGTIGEAWLKKQTAIKTNVLKHPAALPVCGDIELIWKFHPTANSFVDRAYGQIRDIDTELGPVMLLNLIPLIGKLSQEINTAVHTSITPQNPMNYGDRAVNQYNRYASAASLVSNQRVIPLLFFNIPVAKVKALIWSTNGFGWMPEIWGGWSNSFGHGDNNYKKFGRFITGNMVMGTGSTLLFILDSILGTSTRKGSLPNLGLNTAGFTSTTDWSGVNSLTVVWDKLEKFYKSSSNKFMQSMMQTFWMERFIRQGWAPPAWSYMSGHNVNGTTAQGDKEMWGKGVLGKNKWEPCDVHALRRFHRYHIATIRQGLFNDLRLGHRLDTGIDINPVAGTSANFNYSRMEQGFMFGDNRGGNMLPSNLTLGHPLSHEPTSRYYDPMQTVRRLSGVCFPVIRQSGIKWKPIMIAVSGAMDGKQAGTAGYSGPWEPSGQIGNTTVLDGRSVSYWGKEVKIPAWQVTVNKGNPFNNGQLRFSEQWALDGLLSKFKRPKGCQSDCLQLDKVVGPMVVIPEFQGGAGQILPGFQPGKYGENDEMTSHFVQNAGDILGHPNWNPVGVSWAWSNAYKDKQEISLWNQSSDEYVDPSCFKEGGGACIELGTADNNTTVKVKAKQAGVSKVLLRPGQDNFGYDLTDTWGGCHEDHDEEDCSKAVKDKNIPPKYGTPTKVDRHTFQGHGEWNKLWGDLDQKMGIWGQNFSRVYIDDISFAVFASGSGQFVGAEAFDVPWGEPVGWTAELGDGNFTVDQDNYINMEEFRTDYVMGAGPATNVVGNANYGKPYYEVADGGIYSSPWHMAWTKNVKERFKVSGWAPYGCDPQGNPLPEAAAKTAAFEMASGYHKDYQVVVNQFHLSGTGDYFVKDDWTWTDSNGVVQNYVPIHQHPDSPFSNGANPFNAGGKNIREMASWRYGLMETSGVGPDGTWSADNEGASNAARFALWMMRWAAVAEFGWKKDANGVDVPADSFGPIPADPDWCECDTLEFKTGIVGDSASIQEELTKNSNWVGCYGGPTPPDCPWTVNPIVANDPFAATEDGDNNYACGGGSCGWGRAGWNGHTTIEPKLDYDSPNFETVATGFSSMAISRDPTNILFPGYGCHGDNDMLEGAPWQPGHDEIYATCCETGWAVKDLMTRMDLHRTAGSWGKCKTDWNLKGTLGPGGALPGRPNGILPDVPLLTAVTDYALTDRIAAYDNSTDTDHYFTDMVFDANKMGTGVNGALYSYKANATVGADAGNNYTYESNPFWLGPSWPEYYHQNKAGKASAVSTPWRLIGASPTSALEAKENALSLWNGWKETEGYKAWKDNHATLGRNLGLLSCTSCQSDPVDAENNGTATLVSAGTPPRDSAVQHFAWQMPNTNVSASNCMFGTSYQGPTGWDLDSIPDLAELHYILNCLRGEAFGEWATELDSITNGNNVTVPKLSTDIIAGTYTTDPKGSTVGDDTALVGNGSNTLNSPYNQTTWDLAPNMFPSYTNAFPEENLESLTTCKTLKGQVLEHNITWQGIPAGGRHATDGGMCADGTLGKFIGCNYDATAGNCQRAAWPVTHFSYPGDGQKITCAAGFLGDDEKQWDGVAVSQGDGRGSTYDSAGLLAGKQISLYEEIVTGLDPSTQKYQIKAVRIWGTCTLTSPPEYRYQFEIQGCDFKAAAAKGKTPIVDTKTFGWNATGQAFCKPKTMNYEAELVKTRYSGIMFASGWVPYVTGITDWTNAGHVVASQPVAEGVTQDDGRPLHEQVAINRLYTGIQHDQTYVVYYPKDEAQGIDLRITDHAVGGALAHNTMAVQESLMRLRQENPTLKTGSLSDLLDFNAEASASERHIVHYDVSKKVSTSTTRGDAMGTYGDLIFMGGWPLVNPAYPGSRDTNDPVWGNSKKEGLLGQHVYLLISDEDAKKIRRLGGDNNLNNANVYHWYAQGLPSNVTAGSTSAGVVTTTTQPNRTYSNRRYGAEQQRVSARTVGAVFTTAEKAKNYGVNAKGERTTEGGGDFAPLLFEAAIRAVNGEINVGYSNYGQIGPGNKKKGGGYSNGVRVRISPKGAGGAGQVGVTPYHPAGWIGMNATFYEFEGTLSACGGADGCVSTSIPEEAGAWAEGSYKNIRNFLNVPPMIQKAGGTPGTKIRGRPYIFKGEQLMASVKTKWEIRSGNWHFNVPHQTVNGSVIDPFAGNEEASFVARGLPGGQALDLKPWHTNIEPKANTTGMYDPRLARTGYAIMAQAGRGGAGWPPGIPCAKSQGKYDNIHDFKLGIETSWLQIPIGGLIDNISMGAGGKTLYVGQCAGTAPVDVGTDVGAEGKWGPLGTEQTHAAAKEHGLNAVPSLETARLNEWLTHPAWGATNPGDAAFVYYDYDPDFKLGGRSYDTPMHLRHHWLVKQGAYDQPGLDYSAKIQGNTKYSDNIHFKIYQGMTQTQWGTLGTHVAPNRPMGTYADYMDGPPPKGMEQDLGPIGPH